MKYMTDCVVKYQINFFSFSAIIFPYLFYPAKQLVNISFLLPRDSLFHKFEPMFEITLDDS